MFDMESLKVYLISSYFCLFQVGSLKDFYLFEHPHVRKRSVNHSPAHRTKLENEDAVSFVFPLIFIILFYSLSSFSLSYRKKYSMVFLFVFTQVKWVQQQHERKRVKRDFSSPSFPSFASFFGGFSQGSSGGSSSHHNHHRAIGPYNIFPDPLFKEQWYMVCSKFILNEGIISKSLPSNCIFVKKKFITNRMVELKMDTT